MIKAVLFDMDGVLIDAKDWHYEALNRALEHFGYTISRESHLSTFDGLPTREKLRILSSSRKLPEGLHDFLNALKQVYTLEISYQRCKPVFNHQFALSRLKKTGYHLAVCSNSVRQSIEAMMKLSSLDSYLDLIVSNQDVEIGKPNPEMYLKAMHSLGVEPHECLILEDNDHGIQAAVDSGGHLLRIGVPDDVRYQAIKSRISELDSF
jgi:beta-phosphoglucomutase-like phosphatase (HAD superfamily)